MKNSLRNSTSDHCSCSTSSASKSSSSYLTAKRLPLESSNILIIFILSTCRFMFLFSLYNLTVPPPPSTPQSPPPHTPSLLDPPTLPKKPSPISPEAIGQFFNISSTFSFGKAFTVLPPFPVMFSAANRELMMASSVASMVARKSAVISSFLSSAFSDMLSDFC